MHEIWVFIQNLWEMIPERGLLLDIAKFIGGGLLIYFVLGIVGVGFYEWRFKVNLRRIQERENAPPTWRDLDTRTKSKAP